MKTGIYGRVSTEEQAKEGYSLRAQEEKLRSYTDIKGWTLADVYLDEGISGKNIVDRPALNNLLADIAKGKIENVLVFKVDRLTRSTKDLIEMVEYFHVHNCAFNSLIESIDTDTATGRMFLKIIGIFAEFERENLVERVKVGLERKVKEGYTLACATTSYGYDRDNGEKIQRVNEKEAVIVREIFDMYINQDITITRIATMLNKRGIPTKAGSIWDAKTVKNTLTNANYIGLVRHKMNDPLNYMEYEGQHEAILDKETFYRAQEKMKLQKKYERTKHSGHDVYFSKIVLCPKCGSRLTSRIGYKNVKDGTKSRYLYYRCNRSVRGLCCFSCTHNAIEEAFVDYIENIEDITALATQEKKESNKGQEQQKKRIEKEIANFDVLMEEVIEKYVGQQIGFEEYKKMTLSIKDKKENLLFTLNRLTTDEREETATNEADIVRNIKINWEYLADIERQEFLKRFVESITINAEKTGYNKQKITIETVSFSLGA